MRSKRLTERQRLLKKCEDEYIDVFRSNIPWRVKEERLETLYNLYVYIQQNRYLRPRVPIPTSSDIRDRVLNSYQSKHFKRIMRVSRSQFDRMLGLVRGSKFFRGCSSSVDLILKVTLFRLGSSGVSIPKVALMFGIGNGTVHDYTWKGVYAIAEVAPRFIIWPDTNQKSEISRWFKENKGFPKLIGALDGVPFPLFRAPSYDTNSWITRKCNFAMGATAVCDHRGIFIFFTTGYVGSMHDAQAYRNSDLFTKRGEFFQDQDYLICDSAYPINPTIIPNYKNAKEDQVIFNRLHSSARAIIEHAFGMLKNKCESLKCLPISINSEKDIKDASFWIMACVVLHNFTRIYQDLDDDEDLEEYVEEYAIEPSIAAVNDAVVNGAVVNDAAIDSVFDISDEDRREGVRKRDQLKMWVLNAKNK